MDDLILGVIIGFSATLTSAIIVLYITINEYEKKLRESVTKRKED